MAVFAISTLIQGDADKEAKLREAIRSEAVGDELWNEIPNQHIIVSYKTAENLKKSILGNFPAERDDLLLVLDLSVVKGFAIHGSLEGHVISKLNSRR